MKRKAPRFGFTLIEILIVVGIISVFAALFLANSEKARSQARDARRISDVNQIEVALEAYFNAQPRNARQYPATLNVLKPDYISTTIQDPKGVLYGYKAADTDGDGLLDTFCLGATLENPANPATNNPPPCTTTDLQNNYKVLR